MPLLGGKAGGKGMQEMWLCCLCRNLQETISDVEFGFGFFFLHKI